MPSTLPDEIKKFLDSAKSLSAGGLTVAEFGELLISLLRLAVGIADTFPAEGEKKKEWVLALVGILFDSVADRMVPIYLLPFWAMFRSGIRSLLLHLASGAVESILPLVRDAK